VPHVIEPAAGADRATLAFLVDAYDEDTSAASRGPSSSSTRAWRP
jgi:glycyl-tRNA synthetase